MMLVGDTFILLADVNVSPDDIEKYTAGNHIQLYLAEIGIKPTLDKDIGRKCSEPGPYLVLCKLPQETKRDSRFRQQP